MIIAIGSDHAGFELKVGVRALLHEWGHGVVDVGTHNQNPVDYPDFAEAVAQTVLDGKAKIKLWGKKGETICSSE